MWTRNRAFYCALSIVAVSVLARTIFAGEDDRRGERLIRQVDHIILASPNAEKLCRLFSEQLQLPIAWQFQSYGTFASGGVSLGTINLELLEVQHGPYGLTQVALEPASLSDVLPALDARGLPHARPAPYVQRDASGAKRLLWTTVAMPALEPAKTIFLCKYTIDVADGRARRADALRKNRGGPLGIERPAEVALQVRDLAAAERQWTKLLAPVQPRQRAWDLGAGPSIRLFEGQGGRGVTLRIKILSLQQARSFLQREHLLGLDGEREISLDPSRLSGADIRFVE